jgi:hypothetical protein
MRTEIVYDEGMTSSWKEGRLAPQQRRALIWSLAALAACLAMNAYHYSLEGAKGLYLWNRTWMFRSLILMGFVPGSVALLSFPLEKLKSKRASKICRGMAIALAVIVILVSTSITAYLIAGPRMGSLEPARLTLISPADGIKPLAAEDAAEASQPSFSSGGAQDAAVQPANAGPSASVGPSANGAADPKRPLLRLSFSSDPHWGAETSEIGARADILAGIAERRPDAFFMLGDTVETGSSSSMWNFALSDLEAIIPKIPLRPLMGNHDALTGGQYLFKKAFFPPSLKSDSGSPYYYSIDAGAATIIVLDLPWGTENFGSRQRSWLERTLKEADRTKPIIALSHSFFYASGYDDPSFDKPWYDHYQNIPVVTPLFEQYGVDLVISGHNHYQEYLEHGGVRYAIIGAMGGILDPEPTYISPASKWKAVGVFGRLDVDIYGAEVVLSYRDRDGALLHEERFGY